VFETLVGIRVVCGGRLRWQAQAAFGQCPVDLIGRFRLRQVEVAQRNDVGGPAVLVVAPQIAPARDRVSL
jgi:hypothetical protein